MQREIDSLSSALAGLRLRQEQASLLIDEAPDQLFRKLCIELEASYPRGTPGENAFSQYSAARGWSSDVYLLPGFARKYVSKKFEARCLGTYEFMRELSRHYMLDLSGAEIADIGAGPGCGTVGMAKFLADTHRSKTKFEARMRKFKSPTASLLDPVSAWQEAAPALQKFGINAGWRTVPSLLEMLSVECFCNKDTPVVIIASHVLADFGGDSAEMRLWWQGLGNALAGRRAIILIMERSPCISLAPKKIPGGGIIHEYEMRMPLGTDNASHGVALLLPEAAWEASREAIPPRLSTPPKKATGPPQCPDCGMEMKLRVNRTGYNPGSRFWGCTGYPACKGTRRV